MEEALNRKLWAISALSVVLAGLAVLRWATWDGALLDFEFTRFRITSWALAFGAATAWTWTSQRRAHRAVGLALMTVPLWDAGLSFLASIPDLQNPNSTLEPYSVRELSDRYIVGLVSDIGYVGVGFLLWLGEIPDSLRTIARRMVEAGVPARTEARSAMQGVLLFPPLLIGSIVLNVLLRSSPALDNGQEASVWDMMTPYHDVMISLTAGFTEELVYRVVGIAVFAALLARLRVPRLGAFAGAVVLQALIFAGAHGGYGTWAHVLLPLAFGLFAGIVYLWRGLWAIVVVHVLVDIYAFGGYTADGWPWFWAILVWIFYANVIVSVAWAGKWLWRRLVGARQSLR